MRLDSGGPDEQLPGDLGAAGTGNDGRDDVALAVGELRQLCRYGAVDGALRPSSVMVLVPATMALMGRPNWWLPAWLDRLLPHLDLEGTAALPPAPRESERLSVRAG